MGLLGVLSLMGRAVRTVIRAVEEGVLALLRTTRWLLNRFRL